MSNAPAKAALPGSTGPSSGSNGRPSSTATSGGGGGGGGGEKIHHGLYRYGQGYWVRVLTAAFAGVVVLSAALWAYKILEAFDLPTPTWSVQLREIAGTPSTGSALTLINDRDGTANEIGSAVVKSIETKGSTASAVIGDIAMKGDAIPSEATKVTSSGGVSAVVAAPPAGIEVFNKQYLQLGVAMVIILVGSYFIYSYVGRREKSVEFLVAVDGEMKKVNWSTRKNVIDSTIVVVVATFLIALILAIYDVGIGKIFAALFRLIGIYQ